MKIAITTHLKEDGSFGIFETGIRQTAIFLQRLLRSMGHEVYLITNTDPSLFTHEPQITGVDEKFIVESIYNAELVICVARQLSPNERKWYRHEGAKIVLLKCGPTALSTMQGLAHGDDSNSETYDDHDWYDEIWLTEHLIKTHLRWCEAIYKVPVRPVPHVWEPLFIPEGFGYVQREFHRFRVGIFEPNNTVTRTSHWPLMVVARALQNTRMISEVHVLNLDHLHVSDHLMSFLDRLGFYNDNTKLKTHLWPRMEGPKFLANECDLVVTHSWENDLHYTLYEALYGGYPLVHSSEPLKAHGYYYPRFDVGLGSMQVLRAVTVEGGKHNPEETKARFASYMPNLQNTKHFEGML